MKKSRLALALPLTLAMLAFSATAQTPASNSNEERARLTPEQVQSIKSIQADAARKSAPVALRLAGIVKSVYENMLSENENPVLRRKLSKEMNRVAGQLLAIKGQSIRDTVRVLTPAQRALVRTEMVKPGAPADLSELISHLFSVPDK